MIFRTRRIKVNITIRTLVYIGWTMSSMTILVIFLVAIQGYPDYAKETSRNPTEIREEFRSGEPVEISNRKSLSGLKIKFPMQENSHSIHEEYGFNTSTNIPRVVNRKRKKKVRRISEKDLDSMLDHRVRNRMLDQRVQNRMTSIPESKSIENSQQKSESMKKFSSAETRRQHRGERDKGADDGGGSVGNLFPWQPVDQIETPEVTVESPGRQISARSSGGIPVVEDEVFWSREAENLVPSGLTEDSVRKFRKSVATESVRSMEAPQWNRCGRPRNQFITLDDGTTLCARYRHPQETLVRGEVLSFYLSKFLAFDNVPPVVLSRLSYDDFLWRKQNFTTAAEWTPGAFVALIQWLDDLNQERSRVRMPPLLLSHYESGVRMTAETLDGGQLSADQLSSLVQWTDLIVFDYITGHYDRVASMQDGAEREMRPGVMAESIRNLRQFLGTGKLVLIDNESGLFDGYELMYHGAQTGLQFLGFHRRLLRTVCVFRRRTVDRLIQLSRSPRPDRTLEDYASVREPAYRKLTETPEVELFRTKFRERLKEVVDWIDQCASRR